MRRDKQPAAELVATDDKPFIMKWSDGTLRRYATAQERCQAMRAWRSDFRAARDLFDVTQGARA